MELRFPARLRPGARVAVIAPAGPIPRASFDAGVASLGGRYELVCDDALFTATGFLAGDDARRRAELLHALTRPDVDAVWCARGGYGITRLLDGIDWPGLGGTLPPRVCLGFSDVTALLAALANAGLASLHGPVVTQLSRLPETDLARLFALLESSAAPEPFARLAPVAAGDATGPLFGGNLEVFTRLLGTPHLPPLDGALLALEEIGERPYRLDRQLTHLMSAGVFTRVRGVVVGELVRCEEPAGTGVGAPSAFEVVRERLAGLGIPVAAGAPFGHGARNAAFRHGGRARLQVDASTASLTFLDPP